MRRKLFAIARICRHPALLIQWKHTQRMRCRNFLAECPAARGDRETLYIPPLAASKQTTPALRGGLRTSQGEDGSAPGQLGKGRGLPPPRHQPWWLPHQGQEDSKRGRLAHGVQETPAASARVGRWDRAPSSEATQGLHAESPTRYVRARK